MKNREVGKMIVILIILALNILTALIVRVTHGGRLICDGAFPITDGKVILVAGMLSQPESAYQYIDFHNKVIGYLRFSSFGFNPKNAAYQLDEVIQPNDTVVGISIGCKPIIMSLVKCRRKILINPMTHSIILKAKNQMLIEYLAPLAEVLSYALGWISLIPFIKTDTGDHYSLALLLDQLYWMYYGDPEDEDMDSLDNVGIVISNQDEFLENDIISSIYLKASGQFDIDTRHGHTANPKVAPLYQDAIDFLF
ncbi:hypothetical protein IJ798_03665 [Candidatus Saccharibacteria bacterium]|nr:hypothetical protein [Candidatus Saccharibacteria bacterium]